MTKNDFLKKIKENFPHIKFKRARMVTHGWDDVVLILDEKLVFSFPKPNQESQLKLKKEIDFLPLLQRRTSLVVPTFTYIPKGKAFVGYKFIKGVPLSRQRLVRLNPSQREKLAKQIATFLKSLHNIPLAVAKKRGVGEAWSDHDALQWHSKHMRVVLKHVSKKEKSLIMSVFTNLKGKKYFYSKTVVHQDFTSDHLLYDARRCRLVGIIDFGDVQISDPAGDVSKLWYYGESFVDLVLKYYGTKDRTFKERTLRHYFLFGIGLLYYGLTTKRKGYWSKGKGIVRTFFELHKQLI